MDTLQTQVNVLSTKVDALSTRIEYLSHKVSDVVVECRFGAEQAPRTESETYAGYRSQLGYGSSNNSLEHKDVLVDAEGVDSPHTEKQLTPEIQIQRLTAQLTAAYNRIAALEEQLLSKRVH
jgi:hypothetical protein